MGEGVDCEDLSGACAGRYVKVSACIPTCCCTLAHKASSQREPLAYAIVAVACLLSQVDSCPLTDASSPFPVVGPSLPRISPSIAHSPFPQVAPFSA